MNHHAILVRSNNALAYTTTDEAATYFTYDRTGVDEVRMLTSYANLRPAKGAQQLFVVRTLSITHEAQNALLKLVEEPPVGLSFQFVLPAGVGLLSTLLSRLQLAVPEAEQIDDTVWRAFESAPLLQRLEQIEAWQKTKDPVWLQSIRVGVHHIPAVIAAETGLVTIQLIGEKLATRGAGNKMLLEHLALSLPLRK